MSSTIEKQLGVVTGDAKLAKDIAESYNGISAAYFAGNPVGLLHHLGVFVEGIFRVAEHMIFGAHTPLSKKIDIDEIAEKLQKTQGAEGIRIHVARLSRVAYDFRSRKKSVHLTSVDPQLIDSHLLFEITTWTLIEVMKESGLSDAEATVKLLATRKTPLVEGVDGILRTTKSELSVPERILLLLYAQPTGFSEEQLFASTRTRVSSIALLRRDLGRLEKRDCVHKRRDGMWVLFGKGRTLAEGLFGIY